MNLVNFGVKTANYSWANTIFGFRTCNYILKTYLPAVNTKCLHQYYFLKSGLVYLGRKRHTSHARIQRGAGDLGPLENHKLLFVSLELLVGTLLEKQSSPLGPIAPRGRSVWLKEVFITPPLHPPDVIFWIHACFTNMYQ